MKDKIENAKYYARTFTLKLTDTDVQLLYGRAAAHGITVEELLENFVTDLVDGAACSDWDNYETANEYFDSRYYSRYQYSTFLAFLIRERLLSVFLDIYDANSAFDKEIKYLLADKKITEEEKGVNLAYFMQCKSENDHAISEMYSNYSRRNPRGKSFDDELKVILNFRKKLTYSLLGNPESEAADEE